MFPKLKIYCVNVAADKQENGEENIREMDTGDNYFFKAKMIFTSKMFCNYRS